MKLLKTAAILATLTASAAAGITSAGQTLDEVRKRGFVRCGVSQGLPGFSDFDERGNWQGIDVDLCKAVAAAVFADGSKVKFTPLSAQERFLALQAEEIDLLVRNTTWTLTRDAALALNFAGVNYYDGQGFMVRKKLGIESALQLTDVIVCASEGTTTELNTADYFRSNKIGYRLSTFEAADEAMAAYDAGRCDVYTGDQSGLYAQRMKLRKPDEHIILPEVISKEPLAPAVLHGDDEWLDIVKWSLNCMINAEEAGITALNVDLKVNTKDPALLRLLGKEGDTGKNLRISNYWCKNIIKQVGNYGESFERNLGQDSPLKIGRGINALWNRGGILYAPPIQ